MLFFDVNETLLDLSAMKASVAAALGGREDLFWFTTMLQYSLVATVGGDYEEFGAIGAAAMTTVAGNNQITLSLETARHGPALNSIYWPRNRRLPSLAWTAQ
jgi:2-haloacid dehalogenase